MAITPPTGIITLMFTDIQGSTALWERLGDAFRLVLERHNHLLRERIQFWDGYEVKTQGDSFMVAFARATDAVECALDVQRMLRAQQWEQGIEELRVRVGIHTGEPFLGYDSGGRLDYFGPMVNRAARVAAAGHGGQILISSATRDVVQDALTGDVQLRDFGRHRLRGLEQLEHIFEVRHPDLPDDFPPLRTLRPERHNLPLISTPLIGRTQEVKMWCALLRQLTTRLLTLLGFGGMGKTRCALQLSELCLSDFPEDFPEGVWWVELEETRSGEEMVNRMASRLPLALQPQPSVREQLWNFLRDRQLLLVLDNTEQNPDATQVIHELLNVAPSVKCIVTTRRALELQVERVVDVPPLPPSDAERLFVERARARKVDFALTPDNAVDVAELCRRLEGVPLAIELAASRIVGMSPREILHRLSERFRLLQTRAPNLPARQRALRGAIDWSYDLLTDDDKDLFAQLAVFAGGFALSDAEAVCDALDVMEGVMELRRHSLLRSETDAATQQTRYFMLESVREYAMEKMQGFTDAGMQVRRRHAEHFLRFAEQQATQERTPNESAALREMERNSDNVRAALLWAREFVVSHEVPMQSGRSDDEAAELCARLALALGWFLELRGFWQTALQFTHIAIDSSPNHPTTQPPNLLIARLLRLQASLHHDLGDLPAARQRAEESLEAFRQLHDDAGVAASLNLLGLIARREGKLDEAASHFEESLRLYRALGDSARAAGCLSNLGLLAERRSEPDTARRFFEESLALARDAGDQRGIATARNNLGMMSFAQNDFAGARRCYTDALRVERELGNRLGIATALHNLGEVAESARDLDRAVHLFSAALQTFTELGSPWATYSADALTKLGRTAEAVDVDEVMKLALEE